MRGGRSGPSVWWFDPSFHDVDVVARAVVARGAHHRCRHSAVAGPRRFRDPCASGRRLARAELTPPTINYESWRIDVVKNETMSTRGSSMSAVIGEFGPAVLFVEDLDRTKAFYVDALGFSLGFEDSTSAGVFLGNDMFLLVTVPSASDMLTGEQLGTPNGQRPVGLFNIFVENVDEVFELLRSKGVEFFIDPVDRDWGRRTAHFKDPDGVVWEISQSIE